MGPSDAPQADGHPAMWPSLRSRVVQGNPLSYRGVNKAWPQSPLGNSRCRSCYHLTGEIVPVAQLERENYGGVTSAVHFKLLSRGPTLYGFSFNGWRTTRESLFGFSARSASRPKIFRQASRHSTETLLTAKGASGGGASMFGQDMKTV
jgi:hypothetical protein